MNEVQLKILAYELLKAYSLDPAKVKKLAKAVLVHFDPEFFTRSNWERDRRVKVQIMTHGTE